VDHGNFGPLLRGTERKSSGDTEGPEDMRKRVEDQEGVGRGQGGPEEVGKAMGEGGRGGKTWESNGTLHQ